MGKLKNGDPRAAYALLTLGEDVRVEVRRVSYNVERKVRAIEGIED